jgi:aminoglycoside phosphotransferase (APT) family kinase protein
MSYFDADTIARYRAMDLSGMPDTCTVSHESAGTVNPDGSAEQGTITSTAYPCRVAPLGTSPVEQIYAARLQGVAGFTFSLPFDASVSEKDAIEYQGARYECIGVLDPVSFQTAVRVACRRVT